MNATRLALWIAGGLVLLAVLPTIWVFARETRHRARTRRALRRLDEARKIIGSDQGDDVARLGATLRTGFDALTVERAVIELLKSDVPETRTLGTRLFAELGLVERYGKLLREARKWSERTQAAETLGLAGVSTAIPALVASLNDRFEDDASVKVAAAAALAKLRDPTAIPLLVKELVAIDERSARNVAEALFAFGVLAVPSLLELLGNPNEPAARVWAARILGRVGDKNATDDLIARLHDRDDLLRAAAAEALGAMDDPRAIQPLVRATLRDPAPQVRAHAAGSLARIQGERAVDVLVAALADPDYATRLRALEAFETIKVEDTSPLESALRDPNANVRRRAALALERVGYLERIIGQLTSTNIETRTRAYAALLELARVGILDSVASYIHHESFEVRAMIARACGELGTVRIAPMLLGRLDDPSWPVRASVAEAIGKLRPEACANALVPLLNDPEETVRDAVAEALTNLPEKDLEPHITALTLAYNRGSVPARTEIVVIVTRLQGPLADELLVRASADPSETVRVRATTALGDRPPEVMVEPLVIRLSDPAISVRMAAVVALGSAATTEAFEGLLQALAGAAPEARERISDALSKGARPQLLQRLDELEKNPSLDVRLGIAWTLGKCGDVAGIPTLGRFLRDSDARLRASAAGALVKIADPAARELLLGAIDDPNAHVRAAVANALGRAPEGDSRTIAALETRMRDPDLFVRNRALVSLCLVGKGAVESRFPDLAREADPSARLTALAVMGTATSVGAVLDVLALPGTLEGILRFLAREAPTTREAFFAAVHLEDPTISLQTPSDVAAFVAQYEQLLRTSLDVQARRFAVDALARLEGGRTVDVLADAMVSDPAEPVRLHAARALQTRGHDPVARKGLCRAVSDPSPEVALSAVVALRGRREKEVALALAQRLGAGTPEVQSSVESTLAEIHREDPFGFMDWMMGGDVAELLVPAIRVLQTMASPATLPLLQQLAQSNAAVVRAATARALGAIPVIDMSTLDEMVDDPSEEVRLAVLDTISWGDSGLLRATSLKRDPSVLVRTRLAVSLARFEGTATKAALKIIEALLADGSAPVRAAALTTLLASKDMEGLLMFARVWPTTTLDTRFELRAETRREAISETLAGRLTTNPEADVRRSAVVALGAIAAPGLLTKLLPALQDPSPEVRIAAIQALAPLDEPEVRTRLTSMLSDPDVAVRDIVRRSLLRVVG